MAFAHCMYCTPPRDEKSDNTNNNLQQPETNNRPGQIRPEQTKSHEKKSDQANQAMPKRPDQTRQGQTSQGKTRPEQSRPGQPRQTKMRQTNGWFVHWSSCTKKSMRITLQYSPKTGASCPRSVDWTEGLGVSTHTDNLPSAELNASLNLSSLANLMAVTGKKENGMAWHMELMRDDQSLGDRPREF